MLNISIKNNKKESYLNDATVIKNKEGKIIAQIFRFKAETSRKVHQGSNRWDCFSVYGSDDIVIISSLEKKPYIWETFSLQLGRRNGDNISLLIYKKSESELGNNILIPIYEDFRIETVSLSQYAIIPEWEFVSGKVSNIQNSWDRDIKIPAIGKEERWEDAKRGDDNIEMSLYQTAIEAGEE